MWIIPAVVAFMTWFFCAGISKELLGAENAANILGLIPAVWTFWFTLDRLHESEYKFLHPAVSKYNLSKKEVLKRLHDYFGEKTINYGSSWRQRTLNSDDGKLIYDLPWTEDHFTFDFDGRGLRERRQKVSLWVGLHIYVQTLDTGSTAVQLDFSYRAEKLPQACQSMIVTTTREIESWLGPSLPVPDVVKRMPLSPEIPAYITAACTLFLAIALVSHVLPKQLGRIAEAEKRLEQAKDDFKRTKDARRKEIADWERHKSGNATSSSPLLDRFSAILGLQDGDLK